MKTKFVVLASMLVFLALYFSVATASTFNLPSGLQTIEEQAFMDDTSLDKVVLPEHIKSIGKQAFANSSITSINLPASLELIADDAFDGCESIIVASVEDT